MTNREREFKRIIAQYNRVITELEQIVRDIEYWNVMHPGEPPIDSHEDRVRLIAVQSRLAVFVTNTKARQAVGSTKAPALSHCRTA